MFYASQTMERLRPGNDWNGLVRKLAASSAFSTVETKDPDYPVLLDSHLPVNDTIAHSRNINDWPDGFQGIQDISGIVRSGRFEMFYGRCINEAADFRSGGFLLHDKKFQKTYVRTGEIQIVNGRKYEDNLDTSYPEAMMAREEISLDLLAMYALMGKSRIKGNYSCFAKVSKPNYIRDEKIEVSAKNLERVKDSIRFMIVHMPDNSIHLEYPGFWNADAPLVVRTDFLSELLNRTGLRKSTHFEVYRGTPSTLYHIEGEVDREKYITVINDISKQPWRGRFCLVGFKLRFVNPKHWKEITDDQISTFLPDFSWGRENGSQYNWTLESQVVYCEDKLRIDDYFRIAVEVRSGVGSSVLFRGNISRIRLEYLYSRLKSSIPRNRQVIFDGIYEYQLSKTISELEIYLSDRNNAEKLVLFEVVLVLLSRYPEHRERGSLFESWTAIHNLGVKNFGGMHEHVGHVYEDMKDAVYKKQVFLHMCLRKRLELYAIFLGCLVVPVLAFCFLRKKIWCVNGNCSFKDWLEMIAVALTFPVSALTLLELSMGESSLGKMMSSGKAKVKDINTFCNVTGLSRNTFWSLVLHTKASSLVKSSTYTSGTILNLLAKLPEDGRESDNLRKSKSIMSVENLYSLLHAATDQNFDNSKSSPSWRSSSQSINIGNISSADLEHLLIIDIPRRALATARRCRTILLNTDGSWSVDFSGFQDIIYYGNQKTNHIKVR